MELATYKKTSERLRASINLLQVRDMPLHNPVWDFCLSKVVGACQKTSVRQLAFISSPPIKEMH